MGYDYCKRNICHLATCKQDIKQHSKSLRSIQLKLSSMLWLLTNIAKKRQLPHLSDTWTFNEEIMGLG